MANLSDHIEQYLKKLMGNSESNIIEIQRNELADAFKCVPSQINYVLTTRFSNERGYVVESRRGGGGFIRIIKLSFHNERQGIMQFINEQVGYTVSQRAAHNIINNLYENGFLSLREARIMLSVVEINNYHDDITVRDRIRAELLKVMFLAVIRSEKA